MAGTNEELYCKNSPIDEYELERVGNYTSELFSSMNFTDIDNRVDSTSKKITVATFNILSPHCILKQYFPTFSDEVLSWDFRRYRIVAAIAHANADVVCLQECEFYFEYLEPALAKFGYTGIYKARPYRYDGCAILWKKDKLELVDSTILYLNNIPTTARDPNRLLKNCIAIIALFKWITGDGDRICVTTTHIYHSQFLPDVKAKQVQYVLQHTHSFLQNHEKVESGQTSSKNRIPVVICGDFNISPTGEIAERKEEELIYKFIKSSDGSMDFTSNTNSKIGTMMFHPFKGLRSAYENYNNGKEPTFTSYGNHFGLTLDYIFYDPTNLHLTKLFTLPPQELLKKTPGIPYDGWGSDHLLLACEFALTK